MCILYIARCHFYVPFSGSHMSSEQNSFNTATAKILVTVEWLFKEVNQYWTIIAYKRNLLFREGEVGALYVASVIRTNSRSCVYPKPISQYFGVIPPFT